MLWHVLQYYCIVFPQAKDMVGLVNKFAATIEEKKGSLSEDEVCSRFPSNHRG